MSTERGFLVRDDWNDDGTIPSPTVAPTASPDVICYQMDRLSPVDAAITYDSREQICQTFMQDMPNNIYIRVKNISGSTLAGQVKAFYAPLNLLYMPEKWIAIKNLKGDKTVLDLVDSSYVAHKDNYAGMPKDAIGINREAFILNAVANPNDHHCMMGLASNSDGSFLTMPSGFSGNEELWWFLRNNREIAYHNMVIIQPFSHTVSLPVEIGNHDEQMRRFVMDVSVTKGVGSLKNATLLMQSTDAECPFSFKFTMDGSNTQYGCKAEIPAAFDGFMNFSVVMPDYAHVDAVLHVKNYAVDVDSDEMTPDVGLRFLSDSTEGQGTLLGDFQLCLGAGYDPAPRAPTHRPFALPTITVHQQM